ncbi:hypothetical protein EB796_009609 [Bugula neritina]|uniref:Uncharacterized protein n=1 Tax=Bugula neritina TaxID=10212 RepID=A0A7J7K0E9_BUGNE|nr:hypothetical protein EB796_009609 [Bugula neritina]
MSCVHTLCQSEKDPCLAHGVVECTPQEALHDVEIVTPSYALSTYHDRYANADRAEEWRRTVRTCLAHEGHYYESAKYTNSNENEAGIVQPSCSARPLVTRNMLIHQVYDISPTVSVH